MSALVDFLRTYITHPWNLLDWVQSNQNYLVPIKKTEVDASPLLKYIYLNGVGAAKRDRFIEKCKKNFLVYIVTIELDAEETTGSCSDDEGAKVTDCIFIKSDPKKDIDVHSVASSYWSNEKKRNAKKRRKEIKKSNSRIFNFFKKILPSKTNRPKEDNTSMNEVYLRNFNYDESETLSKECRRNVEASIMPQFAITAPTVEQSIAEYTNADIMREINSLSGQINDSEAYVKEMIKKYIQDKSVAQDLQKSLTIHEHLLEDVEKRTNNIATDHWLQQIENHKEQVKSLQTSLNAIIRQNRELLEENDTLTRKNEKLSAAFVCLQNSSSTIPPTMSSKEILDDLSRNNDRLRSKVTSVLSQFGTMEDHLKKFQKRCQYLQQQLNLSNAQLQNSKTICEKTKTDYEIHLATVNHELHSANSVIKESTDHGIIIMQDLEMLRMQLQPIAKTINWDKFQKCSGPLPELMHLHRTCINELSSALLYKQKELNIAVADIEAAKTECYQVQRLKDEIETLRSYLDQSTELNKSAQSEINSLKEEIKGCEQKMNSMIENMSEKDNLLDTKIATVSECREEIATLKELILNNQDEYNQIQFNSDRLQHENKALHMQVKGMAQVLNATGAGDIAKELANSQEKLTSVQTQFFALAAENNILLKQIETNKCERQTLVAYQKNCYEQLQLLHKNIEDLERVNDTLKEQLETEKQTVNALQTERVRHLEERTILTAIYERLKSEISKVDQLEGAVTTMNKKASKLALIAEYNKQLGEKLQIEVAEKDVAINELQNNVKQLNSFQMESTKEKVALCEELNKVFSVKEVLNTKLTAELEKNVILDESKREIQNNANLQLKEIQAAYNREHTALKNLVQDVKKLVAERDSLVEKHSESESKCIEVMLEHDKLVEFITTLQGDFKEKEEHLENLEELLKNSNDELERLQKTSEDDISYLTKKFELSSKQVDSLVSENDALKGSLEYLKSDVNKLRNDLDNARQNELDVKNELELLGKTYNELYNEYRSKTEHLQKIIEENESLKMNVYSLSEKYKCLSEENERITQDSAKLEAKLAEKFLTSKISGLPTPQHVENVLDDINARDEEILVLQDRLREHEERAMEMNDLLQTISQIRSQLEFRNQELQHELDRIVMELHNQRQHCEKVEKYLSIYQQNSICPEDLEQQQQQYNATIEEIKKENEKQLKLLETEINSLKEEKHKHSAELQEANSNLEIYKDAHEKLQKAHKVLALKLFTAVRVLLCEKVALESAQSKYTNLEKEKQRLSNINEQNETEIHNLREQLSHLQYEIDEAKCENSALYEDVTSIRANLSDLQNKLNISNQLNISTEEKIKEHEQFTATLKEQLVESRKISNNLQLIIDNLEANSALMLFEKSQADLRIHELQMQAQNELTRNNELKKAMQTTLSLIIELKERGKITPFVHNQLLQSFSEYNNEV